MSDNKKLMKEMLDSEYGKLTTDMSKPMDKMDKLVIGNTLLTKITKLVIESIDLMMILRDVNPEEDKEHAAMEIRVILDIIETEARRHFDI